MLFFGLCFLISYCLCFPFGVASLEILRLSLKKQNAWAASLATGTALGNGLWAMIAYLGVRTVLHGLSSPGTEAPLLGAAAAVALLFGILAFRDSRSAGTKELIEQPIPKTPRKRDAALPVLKGIVLSLLNPQTVGSWLLVLSILKKAVISPPSFPGAGIVFYLTVTAGYWAFFLTVIRVAQRLRFMQSLKARTRMARVLGAFFILMALLLAVGAVRSALR